MSVRQSRAPRVALTPRDAAILALDLKSVSRDGVLVVNVLISALLVALLVGAGWMEAWLGLEAWRPWIPGALAAVMASAPAGPALLFGSILIEERETGVGAALGATPTPRARLAGLRVGLLILYIAAFLGLSALFVVLAWPGLFPAAAAPWAWPSLGLAIAGLALLGAACCLALGRIASNRVEALAAFKAISVLLALPVALPLGPADAWWRPLAQATPSGPAMETVSRLALGEGQAAAFWALAALLYAAALLAAALFAARRA